jgi:hypothetical protein
MEKTASKSPFKFGTVWLIGNDLLYAVIGLIISIAFAAGVNAGIRRDLEEFFTF